MKGVTKEVISEVRARANLVEVISEVVVLKRAGKEYKGLCPFHNEKTPSFNVNPDKDIFKCFGCNEGGDVFAFVQKVKNVGFYDAVRSLAEKYGVQLVETEKERVEQDKRTKVFMLYEQACVYYQKLLKDPTEGLLARKYLEERGITEETIEKFRLGLAPNTWDGLLNYLTKNANASQSTLKDAGLVRERQKGTGFYDLFRNRLMIPIMDERDRVIAFGGRTLDDDQIKYLNSPETPIYQKGKHLFGLNLAKEHIKKSDSVIVVEGYFDAITPHQYGFANTVATLGTALTEQQARLLVKYTESKRVYLSFDADEAGARAVERGVETLGSIAEGIGIELRVIRVPGGKDPDECLASGDDGPEIFSKSIEEAPLLIEYQLDQALKDIPLSSHTGRIEAARKVVPFLGPIKNAVARVEYIRQTAGRINIREEELLSDVRQYRIENRLEAEERRPSYSSFKNNQQSQNQQYSRFSSNRPSYGKEGRHESRGPSNYEGSGQMARRSSAPSGLTQAEKQLLSLYLTSREDYNRVFNTMAEEVLVTYEHQKIKETIEGIGPSFDSMEDLRCNLQDRLAPDPKLSSYLTEIILTADQIQKQNLPVDVVVMNCLARILEERITALIQRTRSKLAAASSDSEENEIQTTIRTLTRLAVELRSSKSLDELVSLKNKIEPIEAKYIERPSTESMV